MKSYEEMTASVLQKAQSRKIKLARNRKIGLSMLLVGCFSLAIWLVGMVLPVWIARYGDNSTISATIGLPTDDTDREEFTQRLTLLCAVPSESSAKVMESNVVLPYKAEIRVWDITGMTEVQLQERILEEERIYKEQMKAIYPEGFHYGRHRRDNVIVTVFSAGCFQIEFEDVNAVARIRATVTEDGYLMAYPRAENGSYSAQAGWFGIDIDGESFRQSLTMKQNESLEMFWQISTLVADKIDIDPNIDLAVIEDTITLVVDYIDGREEIVKVHISVDSQGQVSAMCEEMVVLQSPVQSS